MFSNEKTTFNEFRIKSTNEYLLVLESFLPWRKNFGMIFALVFLFPIEGIYMFRKGFDGIPLILYIFYILPYIIILYALARNKTIIFDKLKSKIIEETAPFKRSRSIDFMGVNGILIEKSRKLDDNPNAGYIQYVRCYKVYLDLINKNKYYIDTFETLENASVLANKIALLISRPIADKTNDSDPEVNTNKNKTLVYVIGLFIFLAIVMYFMNIANLEGLVIFFSVVILFFAIKYYFKKNKQN